jgi:hypothetical protein
MTGSASRSRHAATILLLCLAAPLARAQGTAIVPSADLAYADIDRLAELGVLDSVIMGQRPYSRREIARIVRVATRHITTSGRDAPGGRESVAHALLRRLATRFGEDAADAPSRPSASAVDRATLTAGGTDAVRRGFSGSVTSALEATIDPLAERRLGTPAVSGRTLALELSHRLDPAAWLSFHLTERFEHRAPRDGPASRGAGEILLGGARARFGNVAVRAGREQVTWAQTAGDGLLLASDAPALDLVSVAGDAPFLLPGPLRRLGPTQATILLADLGASVVRSHSKLLAYKVSVQPRRFVELGATFMNHYEGEGGSPSALGNRLIDFLPFVDIFRRHDYTDSTGTPDVDSDKLLGVDGRVRIERLGGMLVVTELTIDDFDVHRIRTLFTWDGAQTLTVVLPRVGDSPFSVQLSAKHTGVRTYTHGPLSNGITTRGRLLGDELGPDGKAFGGAVRWEPDARVRVAIEGRSAIYSQATYVSELDGPSLVVRRVGAASNELRERVIATLVSNRSERVALTARVAAERIRNAGFTGRSRRDYAAEVAFRYAR